MFVSGQEHGEPSSQVFKQQPDVMHQLFPRMMGFRRHAKHCQLGTANDLCRLLNRLGTAWMLREPLAVRLPASAQA